MLYQRLPAHLEILTGELAAEPDVELASKYRELLDRGVDLIETDLPPRGWPVLYCDAEIPESKNKFLHRK